MEQKSDAIGSEAGEEDVNPRRHFIAHFGCAGRLRMMGMVAAPVAKARGQRDRWRGKTNCASASCRSPTAPRSRVAVAQGFDRKYGLQSSR